MIPQDKYKHKGQIYQAASPSAWASRSILVYCALTASTMAAAQTQAETLQASDIDWVKLEDLNPAQQQQVPTTCCGLYVEPNFPVSEGAPEDIDLSAIQGSSVFQDDGGIIRLEGNVEVIQQDNLMQADTAIYDRSNEIITFDGNIKFRQPGLLILGSDAVANQGEAVTTINNASYVMHPLKVRGSAEVIVHTDDDGVITIDNGLYTRCEPGNNDWVMTASSIKLDQEAGRGVARNATLRINNIPVFYTPYMGFPLNDERSSGFLASSFGSTRDGGFEVSTPYYFNLAPNYDATLTPRLMTDRGLMLSLEGRHLGRSSNSLLNMSYLAGDKLYDAETAETPGSDSPPVADRWLLSYDYRARLSEKWTALIDYSAVSDKDYFHDLGDIGLNTASLSYLARNASINYRGEHWDFSTSTQSYQNIDPTVAETSLPYDSLPRVNLNSFFDNNNGLQYGLDTEYIYFDRSIDHNSLSPKKIKRGALVTGQRIAIEPALSWPWATPGIFVTPTLKYKYASYQLEDQAIDTAANPERGLFMASIDSGLIFDRELTIGANNFTQTLEPRVFYLYNEYADQSDIPDFDSADMTFSFDQMFRENRFSGKDRIGDANQITLALSSRFLDSLGKEKASASIGQIFYFEDRRVRLKNRPDPARKHDTSAIASELSYRFNDNWRTSTYLEWNPNTNLMDAGSFQFRYQSDNNHIINASYRYRDEIPRIASSGIDRRTVQTDISLIWPLINNWGFIGRWNYDHANERELETIIGVEYDTCCWSLRLIAREWIDIDDQLYIEQEKDTGIFLQFELKGLGSVLGGSVSSILSNGIMGFREHEYAN